MRYEIRNIKSCLVVLFLLLGNFAFGQAITGIGTTWSDSFREWIVYTENEEEEGILRLRWQDDWTDWEYRIGDQSGRIKIKWKGDPNEWELRGDNEIVSARTLWSNDFRNWRVDGSNGQLTLKTRYGNLVDEWQLRNSKNGNFEIFTSWEGDPREWTIVDELDESVSLPTKMTLIFLAIYHSSPKQ